MVAYRMLKYICNRYYINFRELLFLCISFKRNLRKLASYLSYLSLTLVMLASSGYPVLVRPFHQHL